MGLSSDGEGLAQLVACSPNPRNAHEDQASADAALQIPGAGPGKYEPESRGDGDDLYGSKDVERPTFHECAFRIRPEPIRSDLIRSNPFDQTLARGVNEVRVGWLLPAGAHVAGDLPAMIGRVHDHMRQDVDDRTRPLLALAVLV